MGSLLGYSEEVSYRLHGRLAVLRREFYGMHDGVAGMLRGFDVPSRLPLVWNLIGNEEFDHRIPLQVRAKEGNQLVYGETACIDSAQ